MSSNKKIFDFSRSEISCISNESIVETPRFSKERNIEFLNCATEALLISTLLGELSLVDILKCFSIEEKLPRIASLFP